MGAMTDKTFAQAAQSIGRRSGFKREEMIENGETKIWISTRQDDVFITDVRDGDMIDVDEAVQVLDQAREVAEVLQTLKEYADTLTPDQIRELIEDLV